MYEFDQDYRLQSRYAVGQLPTPEEFDNKWVNYEQAFDKAIMEWQTAKYELVAVTSHRGSLLGFFKKA